MVLRDSPPAQPLRLAEDVAPGMPAAGRRARWLAAAWVLSLVGYSIARALAVAPALGPYGIDPWVFFAIDVGSALPLATAQVRVVHALHAGDPRRVQLWVGVISVSFLAPYAYLLLGAGRPLPTAAYAIVAALVLGFGAATVWRVRHAARRADVRQRPPDA